MPSTRDREILPIEEIKYVFNMAVLQPGDILLMNTYHDIQRKVMERAGVPCIYDHAALYLGDAYIMEANGYGVVMNHIYSYGFKDNKDAIVLRLKNASPILIENAIYNAKSYMGMDFSGPEARLVPQNKDTDKKDTSNRTFCSRLVSQCYSQERVNLFRNPDYCSPDDFLTSDKLFQVEVPLVDFTAEMEATVTNAQNQRNNFEIATYWAVPFQQFSALYNEDIQTMGQLMAAASRHISQDKDALEIITKNNLFQPDLERKTQWPWFDKDEDFFNQFPTIEKQLFFLNCQFRHYDLTYIPVFKQNFASLCVAEYMCPDSKVISRIKRGVTDFLEDAIYRRKRLGYLYVTVYERDKDGFIDFSNKYGFYHNYEYVQTPISIDHILHDMMKASSI